MKTLALELPFLFGDHHVLEVRRILMELPGIENLYVSSAFQVVDLIYDEARLGPDEIRAKLEKAGYIRMLPGVTENEPNGIDGRKVSIKRRTETTEGAQTVSFIQMIPSVDEIVWPCPGFGPVRGDVKNG
ncbi:MAG: heavy-metal-associated domain-containing protein [Anaerolineaceae bacterium]|nr:heavy-metal-associated domain-containing protein [Anaerolineaceae bacterium]